MARSYPWRWPLSGLAILAAALAGSWILESRLMSILSAALAGVALIVVIVAFSWYRILPRRKPFLVPLQLPAAPSTFVGRERELGVLGDALSGASPRLLNICGPGGTGKTALAIVLARGIAKDFPGGHLYAPLSGVARNPGKPVTAQGILRDFVYALQPAGRDVPPGMPELLARYRALTAKKRVLVVIDDPPGDFPLESFLPAGGGCATIVTSRERLAAVPAEQVFELGPLPDDAAKQLLATMTESADPEFFRELARSCGWLPLALRLAGSALSQRPKPEFSVALARAMKDSEGPGKGQPLDAAYGFLTRDERSALRSISAIDEEVFSSSTFAAVAGVEEVVARKLADRLADAMLLERLDPEPLAQSSYTAQDVIRRYAGRRAELEDPSDVRAGRLDRLAGARAKRNQAVSPKNVRREVFQLEMKGSLAKALEAARAALTATQEQGDEENEWAARAAIAELSAEVGNVTEARAMALRATAAHDLATRARSYRSLGHAQRRLYQTGNAIQSLTAGLQLAEEVSDRAEQARVLCELALASAQAGLESYPEAEDYAEHAERICRMPDPASPSELGRALTTRGRVLLRRNRFGEAGTTLQAARDITASGQQDLPLAYALYWQAELALRSEDFTAARASIADAIDRFAEMQHYHGLARCRKTMADIELRNGTASLATQFLQEALETFHSSGDPSAEAEALLTLGESLRRLGSADEAAEARRKGNTILALLREEGGSGGIPSPAHDQVGPAAMRFFGALSRGRAR